MRATSLTVWGAPLRETPEWAMGNTVLTSLIWLKNKQNGGTERLYNLSNVTQLLAITSQNALQIYVHRVYFLTFSLFYTPIVAILFGKGAIFLKMSHPMC